MKRILIVDDSEMARTTLKFALKIKKYEVTDAENGQDALSRLREYDDIGLIITDINMPVMNGLELIKALRNDPDYRALPVIGITTDEDMGKQIVAEGATHFIIKSSKTSEEVHKIITEHIPLHD